MKPIFLSAILATAVFVSCNTSTIPGECIEAMRDNNVPENVIQLVTDKASGELNLIERTAVRLAFEKAGVDDICGKFAE